MGQFLILGNLSRGCQPILVWTHAPLGKGDAPCPLVVCTTGRVILAIGKHRGGRKMGRSRKFGLSGKDELEEKSS